MISAPETFRRDRWKSVKRKTRVERREGLIWRDSVVTPKNAVPLILSACTVHHGAQFVIASRVNDATGYLSEG